MLKNTCIRKLTWKIDHLCCENLKKVLKSTEPSYLEMFYEKISKKASDSHINMIDKVHTSSAPRSSSAIFELYRESWVLALNTCQSLSS